MAVTNQQVLDFLKATPGMSDAQIFAAMRTFGVPPSQMAAVSGVPVNAIIARLAPLIPPNEAVLLGDTYVQSIYDVIGSGEDQQLGGLKNILTYKADENKTGGAYNQYLPTGELERAGTQQAVEANKDFLKFLAGSAALFGGAALAGAGGGAATVGTTGLTAAELAQLDLALGGVGGTTGATSLGSALTTGANVGTLTNLTGGSGVGTAGVTGANSAFLGEGTLSGVTASDTALANVAGNTTTSGLLTNTAGSTVANTAGSTLANTAGSTVANTAGSTLANTAGSNVANTAGSTLANTAATTLTATELANAAKLGLTAAQYAQLFTSTAQTAAGLLQQQTSKEAAQKAQAMIDAETAAAKASAQFRPVGMTTRFGTSQFVVDPKTGQLTSAGYTLSPEAKNAQDRFLTLAAQGLTQAEGAQKAFEPLQKGAESLFKLGAGYLAEKPETVAQNYLNQQMALLKPGRELELASLQNRLQQQGRGGLSVAQGGTLGATTPELQALYNARAQQEAQLAANAQQYGQQQVAFGAGLLGTGAQTMGQYYGGQQAAYAPYTTAFGQMQALEAAGQQPLQMGINLGQIRAQTGFDVGRLGLQGAGQSVALATGPAATNNPYASLLSGVAANPLFGQAAASLFTPSNEATAINPYFKVYG